MQLKQLSSVQGGYDNENALKNACDINSAFELPILLFMATVIPMSTVNTTTGCKMKIEYD